MNLTEALHAFLLTCPDISEFLNVNRFDAASPSFSVNFVSEEKVLRRYFGGGEVSKVFFDIVCNRTVSADARLNLENSSLYEKIAKWLDASCKNGSLPEIDGGAIISVRAEGFPALSSGISTIATARYSLRCSATVRRDNV